MSNDNRINTSCGDCGVLEGEYHAFGCDMEKCPNCSEQILYCGCTTDEIKEAGRYPHILYPLMCGKCGKLWPDFFMVPSAEWQCFIEPSKQHLILCRPCYNSIRSLSMAYEDEVTYEVVDDKQ